LIRHQGWHTAVMNSDYQQQLEEVRAIARRIRERDRKNDEDRDRIRSLIPQLFPDPTPRGRLTEVVEATGWTREYVARIRDGKVKPSRVPARSRPRSGGHRTGTRSPATFATTSRTTGSPATTTTDCTLALKDGASCAALRPTPLAGVDLWWTTSSRRAPTFVSSEACCATPATPSCH